MQGGDIITKPRRGWARKAPISLRIKNKEYHVSLAVAEARVQYLASALEEATMGCS